MSRGWIVGFSIHGSYCSSSAVELLGARQGLMLAWEKSFRKIIFEIDSKDAMESIINPNDELDPLGALIQDCKDFTNRNWDCRVTHTLREGNCCTNFLAKSGALAQDNLCIFESPRGTSHMVASQRDAIKQGLRGKVLTYRSPRMGVLETLVRWQELRITR
ncbi:hypothetical protein L1049_024525 [Liquidambar formosana]|uniref:RNase H type-1 domain-containing protein n=1 Tax=Liquidambar formosana TaxID=63359 RepID=A0AAP0S1P2_LIQFO